MKHEIWNKYIGFKKLIYLDVNILNILSIYINFISNYIKKSYMLYVKFYII